MSCSASPIPPTHSVVRLISRPIGQINPNSDLNLSVEPTPRNVRTNEVLLHRLYLSLDPAMRGWMRDIRSYIPPVKLKEIMRGHAISEVVFSKSKEFKVGDIVETTEHGWCEFAIVEDTMVTKLPMEDFTFNPERDGSSKIPVTSYLGVLGFTGLTAYFGLLDVGKPKAGDVVLVSGAAGATGNIVCQIAKNVGCVVIGICGTDEKCDFLKKELKIDATINYRNANNNPKTFQKLLRDAVKSVGKDGIDIFFDNVGGMILNETLRRLNMKARVVICGAISTYNDEDTRDNVFLSNYLSLLTLRAKMEGFVVFDYVQRFNEARKQLIEWMKDGKLQNPEDIREGGLKVAAESLLDLFKGGNTGKLIVKVGPRMTQFPDAKI